MIKKNVPVGKLDGRTDGNIDGIRVGFLDGFALGEVELIEIDSFLDTFTKQLSNCNPFPCVGGFIDVARPLVKPSGYVSCVNCP